MASQPVPADLLTQLQLELNNLSNYFIGAVGELQRDAPPASISGEDLLEAPKQATGAGAPGVGAADAAYNAGARAQGFANEIIGIHKNIETLIQRIPRPGAPSAAAAAAGGGASGADAAGGSSAAASAQPAAAAAGAVAGADSEAARLARILSLQARDNELRQQLQAALQEAEEKLEQVHTLHGILAEGELQRRGAMAVAPGRSAAGLD